jgi:flavin reductase (DIM6/NTAB) family NADH-FMN oxidoreductase RutF
MQDENGENNLFWMKWWCPLCIRPTPLVGFL